LQRRGNICFEDFEYIKNQDEKVLMLFPIHEAVTDPMCFLKILQQTLQRRLLIPIKVAKKQTNQLNSFNSQNSLPNTSSMLALSNRSRPRSVTAPCCLTTTGLATKALKPN
jgi:hypothetical protein